MKVAGNLAAKTLDLITDYMKPGITTDFIDKLGYEFIRDNGGYSAPLYYRGFTKSLCTSLNHVVCHGILNARPPKNKPLLPASRSCCATAAMVSSLARAVGTFGSCVVGGAISVQA